MKIIDERELQKTTKEKITKTETSKRTNSCSSSYIGETCRHFKTRIEKHIKKDNKSHIFKHFHSTATCFDSYNSLCFKVIDKTNSKFDIKVKEALHINWKKPNFNSLQNHLALSL